MVSHFEQCEDDVTQFRNLIATLEQQNLDMEFDKANTLQEYRLGHLTTEEQYKAKIQKIEEQQIELQGSIETYKRTLEQVIENCKDILPRFADIPDLPSAQIDHEGTLKYDIVIIYDRASKSDSIIADGIAEQLEKWLFCVWHDRDRIVLGTTPEQAYANAIASSTYAFVLIHRDTLQSLFVNMCLKRIWEDKKVPFIIPIIIEKPEPLIFKSSIVSIPEPIEYIDNKRLVEQINQSLVKPKYGLVPYYEALKQLISRTWFDPEKHNMDMNPDDDNPKLVPLQISKYGQPNSTSFFIADILDAHQRVLILGEPGTGKTIALERFAYSKAEYDSDVVPILIPLNELNSRYEIGKRDQLLQFILRKLEEIDQKVFHIPNPDFKAFLQDVPRRFYFLFDGLDDISQANTNHIVDEIVTFSNNFPNHSIAITCRIHSEIWRQLFQREINYARFQIERLQSDAIISYLKAHIAITKVRFEVELGNKPNLAKMLEIPLLLRFTRIIWGEHLRESFSLFILPNKQVKLYEAIIQHWLKRVNQEFEREGRQALDAERRLNILKEIAYWFQRTEKKTVAYSEIKTFLEDKKGDIEAFNFCLEYDTLLRKKSESEQTGDPQIEFGLHPTIGEYFVAHYLKEQVVQFVNTHPGLRIVRQKNRFLYDIISKDYWSETLVLLGGLLDQSDADKYIQILIDKNPLLAWWCIRDGVNVSQLYKDKIEAEIKRRLASENVRVRLETVRQICVLQTPLTTDLLFDRLEENDDQISTLIQHKLMDSPSEVRRNKHRLLSKLQDPIDGITRKRIGIILSVATLHDDGTGTHPNGMAHFKWKEIPVEGYTQESSQPTRAHLINYPFWMSSYPVTRQQYQNFLREGYEQEDIWPPHGFAIYKEQNITQPEERELDAIGIDYKYGNFPILGVSWYECMAFARWYTRWAKTHSTYENILPENYVIRLPTESEWERATTWPDGLPYPSANRAYLLGSANVDERDENGNWLKNPTSVGVFPNSRNALGIDDLWGNVTEWCLNLYSDNWPGIEDIDITSRNNRAYRSAAWNENIEKASALYRRGITPTDRGPGRGFRLVIGPQLDVEAI